LRKNAASRGERKDQTAGEEEGHSLVEIIESDVTTDCRLLELAKLVVHVAFNETGFANIRLAYNEREREKERENEKEREFF